MQFVQPIAVGFVAYSAYKIAEKVIHTKTSVALMVSAAMLAYFFQLPWVLPLLLLAGGAVTTFRYSKTAGVRENSPCALSGPTFAVVGCAGGRGRAGPLHTAGLPVRLFENFYRNG